MTDVPPCKDWAEAKFSMTERDIVEVKMRIDKWDRWWKYAMATLIAAVVTVAGFMLSADRRLASVETTVENVKTDTRSTKGQMEVVKAKVDTLQKAIESQQYKQDVQQIEKIEEMKKIILEALDNRKQRGRQR